MVRALLILASLALAGCEDGPDNRVDLLGENAYAGDISKDGRIIVLAGTDAGIKVYLDQTERHSLTKSNNVVAIEDASISPDGRRIATASGNSYAIFSSESGRRLQEGTVPGLIKSIAVDNRSRLLLGTLQGAFWLSGDNNLQLSTQPTRAVALDGRRGIIGNDQGQVSVWALGATRPDYQFQMDGAVQAVAIDGAQAAASAKDVPTRLLSVGSGGKSAELPQETHYYPTPVFAEAMRITPNGIWIGNSLKRAAYWDFQALDEPAQIWRMPTRGGSNPGSARILGFSKDTKKPAALIATGHRVELIRD